MTLFFKKEVIGKGFNVSSALGTQSVFLVVFPPLEMKQCKLKSIISVFIFLSISIPAVC